MNALGSGASDHRAGVLACVCPRALIQAVLAETGKASQRERLLPAPAVVYYVMALWREAPLAEVLRVVCEGLQWLGGGKADMLVLADRNFHGFKLWQTACASGARLVWPVKSSLKLPVQHRLADGSYPSTVLDSADRARRSGQTLRGIDYTLRDSATPVPDSHRLLTNLLDPDHAPALELAALTHEHRQIEGVFDELKTHLRDNSTAGRSKTPALVQQELWGLLLAHFAIRQLMVKVAWPHGLDPDPLSSTHAVRVIKRKLPQAAALPS